MGIVQRYLAGVSLCCLACADAPAPPRDSVRAAPVASVAPATVALPPWQQPALPSAAEAAADPTAALTRYLAYGAFRGAPSEKDSLAECPPLHSADDESQEGWEPDAYVGFVRPAVLSVTADAADSTGRTATGRVALVRVVSIGRGEHGWEGALETQPDTLDFTLQHAKEGWTVCGPITKGAGVGVLTFDVTYVWAKGSELGDARWQPAGTTWDAAARHADSVVARAR